MKNVLEVNINKIFEVALSENDPKRERFTYFSLIETQFQQEINNGL